MNAKTNNLNKSEIDKIIHLYKQKKFDDALILSNKLLKKSPGIINRFFEKLHKFLIPFIKSIINLGIINISEKYQV